MSVERPELVDEFEALRRRLFNLLSSAVDELEKDLKFGATTQRQNALKLLLPVLTKSMEKADTDGELDELKDAVMGMMQQLGSA